MFWDYRYYTLPPLLTTVLLVPAYYVYYDYFFVGVPQAQRVQPYPLPVNPHLENFPHSVKISFNKYQNWAEDIQTNVWVAYPQSAYQVIELANWARANSYRLRPSGYRQSSAPLTVEGNDSKNQRVIVVDTTEHFKTMQVISTDEGDSSFWAEPGIPLEALLAHLEDKELGLASFPSTGNVSLGGVLAVGSHGIGIEKEGEKPAKGHSYGSLSNLIISLTAVVYDPYLNSYALRKFNRSDPEIKAFLVNFGRTFVTNVTMRAGPLSKLHYKSRFDIKPDNLFGKDPTSPETFLSFVNQAGRAEALYFPAQHNALLKTWETTKDKPGSALEVKAPYNKDTNIESKGNELWGTPKNVLLFADPKDPPMSFGSWAILTNRTNVQRVAHEFYHCFQETLALYKARGLSPSIGFAVRILGQDKASDVLVEGAEVPAFSTLQPIESRPDLNCTLEINVFSSQLFSREEAISSGAMEFFTRLETFIVENFNSPWSVVRMEWPGSWAFTPSCPWSNYGLVRGLKSLGAFSDWGYSVEVLNKYDPGNVFSNDFVNEILYSY